MVQESTTKECGLLRCVRPAQAEGAASNWCNLRIMGIMTMQAKTAMRFNDRMAYFCHNACYIMRKLVITFFIDKLANPNGIGSIIARR